jgi:hypothetical protein
LDFKGVPSGIDVLKVVKTGITPLVNTGVASKRPGVGQIGAGTQSFPLACFALGEEPNGILADQRIACGCMHLDQDAIAVAAVPRPMQSVPRDA